MTSINESILRIKSQLNLLNLTYEDLSEKTNISVSTIKKYMTGKQPMGLNDRDKILLALHDKECELLKSSNQVNPNTLTPFAMTDAYMRLTPLEQEMLSLFVKAMQSKDNQIAELKEQLDNHLKNKGNNTD